MPEPAKSSKRPSKPRPRQSDKAWGWNPWHQTDYAPLMAEPQPKRMANFVSQQHMPEVQGVLAEHWDQLPEAVQSALVQVGVDSPESAPMQDESDPKYITQQYKQATGHLRALGQRKLHQDLKAKRLAEQLAQVQKEQQELQAQLAAAQAAMEEAASKYSQVVLASQILEPPIGSLDSAIPQEPQEIMAKVGDLLAQATTTMDPDQKQEILHNMAALLQLGTDHKRRRRQGPVDGQPAPSDPDRYMEGSDSLWLQG